MSKTKRISERITVNQSIFVTIISGLAMILLLGIFYKTNYYALLFLILLLVLLYIFSANISIHKIAVDKYMNMQNATLRTIEKDLSSSFTRVEFVDKSRTDMVKNIFLKLDLSFWAKIDENGIITLIAKDSRGAIIYEEMTQDYIWFYKKFLHL